MRARSRLLLLGTALAAATASTMLAALVAAPGATPVPVALAERAKGKTPLEDDLRELCDRIGGRPTGSAACGRAIVWGRKAFERAGLADVRLEAFRMPSLWLPRTAEGSCLSPESFAIRVAASPGSPSTPDGRPLEARLVDAGEGRPEDFARLGKTAEGAIALVRNEEMKSLEDLFAEYMANVPRLEAARRAGVVALLLESTRPRGLLYRHPVVLDGTLAPVPVAVVSREHAARLARLSATGEVRVRLALSNETGPPYESQNVVAEIRGRERPEEVVLLGAHLDSWDLGTGAEDNGVNVALVVDVARGMASIDARPRRTVRFALFTGEEQGLWGSAGYVRRHAAELDSHAAAVIFDIGSGKTQGFFLDGREELRKRVDDALAAVPALGSFQHPLEVIDGTDNFDFFLAGVPNLVALQDATTYLPDYHAESDVFERVSLERARENVAVASALVWGLADGDEPLLRRLTRAEVEKQIVDLHLEEQMRALGQWPGWVAGERGAPARP